MASTHKHIRSSTANKRPTTAIADGQVALNTNASSPGLFFKDSTGASIIKIGPVHVGSTAPNATPASGGSSGNSTGEIWLDNSLTPVGVKIWDGSAWVNATPAGSTTVQGLLELATSAETQTGTDTDRAVTPAGLQSKLSDSTSTTSSTTIASSTAVKSAYDLAAAALPLSGGTITGNLEIGTTGSLSFEGSTADAFETTIAVTDPTADRTITLPDQTGNFLVSGNASIVNADVNASAAIAGTKISPDFGSQTITTTGVVSAALGAAATPSITFTGDLNTGIYSPGADQVAITTNGVERVDWGTSEVVFNDGGTNYDFRVEGDTNANLLFVDASADAVGIGTSSPATLLHVAATGDPELRIEATGTAVSDDARLVLKTTNGEFLVQNDRSLGASGVLTFNGASTDNLCIDHATGRVGIGTTSPAQALDVSGSIAASGSILAGLGTAAAPAFSFAGDPDGGMFRPSVNNIAFSTLGTEAVRIDSSGRLLVGTSSSLQVSGVDNAIQVEGTNTVNTHAISAIRHGSTTATAGSVLSLGRSRGTSVGSKTAVANGDTLGIILFAGANGTDFSNTAAWIRSEVDGEPFTAGDTTDLPGRLVFSTTADGASSPTERMRIDSAGNVGIGRAPTCELDVYRSSGTIEIIADSDSLANDQVSVLRAMGGARTSSFGVYKHSGITNPCSYLQMAAEDNATNSIWVDNSDQLRISTTASHIGTTSGTVVGTQTSDERLKNILGPVEYGLDTLKQIEPVRYALKTEPDTEKLGFIAQQVLPFIPQSVFDTGEVIEEGEPTKLGMEYVALIPVLVNAIKELSAEVNALKAQLQ